MKMFPKEILKEQGLAVVMVCGKPEIVETVFDFNADAIVDYLNDFPEDAWRDTRNILCVDISKTGVLIKREEDVDIDKVRTMLLVYWTEKQITGLDRNQLIVLFLITFKIRSNPLILMRDMLETVLTKKEMKALYDISLIEMGRKIIMDMEGELTDEDIAGMFSGQIVRGLAAENEKRNSLVLARFHKLFNDVFLQENVAEEYVRPKFLAIL